VKTPLDTPEFAKFTETWKTMLKVSKTEMKRRIKEDKATPPSRLAAGAEEESSAAEALAELPCHGAPILFGHRYCVNCMIALKSGLPVKDSAGRNVRLP